MPEKIKPLARDVFFLALAGLGLMTVFTLLRGLLLWRNEGLAASIPDGEIMQSFLIGVRFDLIVTAYILLPPCLALFLPTGLGRRRLVRFWLMFASAVIILLGIAELDFYREFQTRLNSLVFQYAREDPETVSKMIWAGFPVVRYTCLAGLLWAGLQAAIHRFNLITHASGTPLKTHSAADHALRSTAALAILLVMIAAARGSVSSGPPLRWGDAIHSEHIFANHLALNGTFTLIKAVTASQHSNQNSWWLKGSDTGTALRTTRSMVMTPTDSLEQPGAQPLLRQHTPSHSYPAGRVKNLVLIIMESFAGNHVGALGDRQNITPEFDALAREGLLFTRFFANGTHTHQGMFASVGCFPNLPGHEYLMQQPEGLHSFSGLPRLFNPGPDNNAYIYNGDFRWDNQEGFFRNQGMDNFIGRDQIDNPRHTDAVWGVSDEDVFHQALSELDNMSARGRFYAVIQTLSNHTPFSLPSPLPVKAVSAGIENAEHLTAMRYSDWALGEFFRQVRSKSYYRDTLFVIVGDHGFGSADILSQVNLNRFHVPLLLIAPGIDQVFGSRNDTVSSQVDIVPTVMSLMGKPFLHQCWGRDLLSLHDDPGFAVIKPSGSDQTVALVEGDKILTLSPETPPELGHLSFGPELGWVPLQDENVRNGMKIRLKSYISTALLALKKGSTGTPAPGEPGRARVSTARR